MDVICTCCGEPWDIYHVLHEEPQAFDREARSSKLARAVTGGGLTISTVALAANWTRSPKPHGSSEMTSMALPPSSKICSDVLTNTTTEDTPMTDTELITAATTAALFAIAPTPSSEWGLRSWQMVECFAAATWKTPRLA